MSRIIDQMSRNTTDLPPGVSNAGGDGGQYDDPTVPAPADGVIRGGKGGDPPHRGVRSGLIFGDDYGANLELGFNPMGSAHMASDPPELCHPKGDSEFRFSSSGHSADDHYGSDHGLGSNDKSDPADMHAAHDQSMSQEMTTGPKGPIGSGSHAAPAGAETEGSLAEEAAESPAKEAEEKRRGYD